MPSRRSRRPVTDEREERKKRQEKFRKRTKSLFNKTRLLARDTDAWVALIVRDRAGKVQSFRASGRRSWPSSIQDLMATHPSGTHEFFEKQDISGCWKAVADDESDTGLVDGDAESVDEGVPTMSVTPVEEEVDTISVDQSHVGEEVEDGANAPTDEPNETVVEPSAVDPLESDITPLRKELDETLVDPRILYDATIDAAGVSGKPRVDSPGENAALESTLPDNTIFEFEEPVNMTVDAIEESNNTTTGMAVDSPNTTALKLEDSDNVPDVPGEETSMGILGTAEPDPTPLEYDMMDLDIQGAQNNAPPDVRQGDPLVAANPLYTTSQCHNPPSCGGLSSWQVLNLPKVDPKELLQSWTWVFHN